MSGLGNVFDAVAPPDDAERGPDLHVEVEVPRSALGRAEGFVADVPDALPHEGGSVPRVIEPGHEGEGLRLHLSATLPERATLRLRGQGGAHADGVPGDLFVQIRVVDDPARRLGVHVWAAIAVLVAAAAVATLLAVT